MANRPIHRRANRHIVKGCRKEQPVSKFSILTAVAAASTAAIASPVSAQWHPSAYSYGYGISREAAVNRCANSVERRLGYRRDARVLDITQVRPYRSHLRVRGVASAGTEYRYGRPYRANLWFTCDIDRRGHVGNLSFYR